MKVTAFNGFVSAPGGAIRTEGEQAVSQFRGTAVTTLFAVVKTRYTLTQSGLEAVLEDFKEQAQGEHLPSLSPAKPQPQVLSSHREPQGQDTHELKFSLVSNSLAHSRTSNPTSSLEPALPAPS